MKFFLFTSALIIVTLFMAIGFGFDWWNNRNAHEIRLATMPEDSMENNLQPSTTVRHPELVFFPEIANEKDFHKLVDNLDSAKTVNERGVGICGIYTWQYACYERMKKITPPQELFYLTYNKNPIVKAYAFMALCEMDSSRAVLAKHHLKNDNDTIVYISGCIRMTEHLKEFITYRDIR